MTLFIGQLLRGRLDESIDGLEQDDCDEPVAIRSFRGGAGP